MRFGEMAPPPGAPPMAEADKKKILHIELPILAGHILMGTDMLESMGQTLRVGNNTTVNLECDTRAEADKLYAVLSEGSTEGSGMAPMFWGAYWGSCLDRFGIRWMFNAPLK
jgi:PhnB protein